MNLVGAALLVLAIVPTEPKPDEVVVFYPTWGRFDVEAQLWRLPIHAAIYEPDEGSWRRSAALGVFRHFLDLEPAGTETVLFDERAANFLVDNEGGKRLFIRLGDMEFALAPSESNGHTITELTLTPDEARTMLSQQRSDRGWLTYQAVLPKDDPRTFVGAVQLLGDRGLSVISDVDDTIKITEATNQKAMLRNTFLRPFTPVEGMPELYEAWLRQEASFHYVSATPWQLFLPLSNWCREARYPYGSYDLRLFRLKDRTAFDLLKAPDEFKRKAIEPLLTAFPKRTFVLVGDTGGHDPEIYGNVARAFPQHAVRIYIRNVTNEAADSPRFRTAFAGVPGDRWQVFRDVGEIDPQLTAPAEAASR
jgi:uncharacterized protein DUF2183